MHRITERKIPSISELYKASDIEVGVQEFDENKATKYNELVNKDFDIDIDFSGSLDVKVQDSLGEEVEHKIKNKDSNSETTTVSKIVLNEKEADYENMNTLIVPINKVVKKGVTAGEVKISTAITLNMSKFFDYPTTFHMLEDEKGKLRETNIIELEVFENMSKFDEKDEEAKIIQTEKNTIIKSSKLAMLDIVDGDIMRLIKKEDGKYRCEIIKQDSSEYNIWENFCTVTVKGTSKKIGVI